MLGKLTLEYAGLAVAGVGIVLLITLVHPLSSLLMMISVALVMLYLFGEMWIFNIRFNQVIAQILRLKCHAWAARSYSHSNVYQRSLENVFSLNVVQLSVISMIMATGLAVDYSVYLAQKFMTTPGWCHWTEAAQATRRSSLLTKRIAIMTLLVRVDGACFTRGYVSTCCFASQVPVVMSVSQTS